MIDYCDAPTALSEWHEHPPQWVDTERWRAFRQLASALKATQPRGGTAALSISDRFAELADKWERETTHLSATPMRVMHDSYQSIMAMGPDVVPLLLSDLQKTRRHWFWALRHLTGADPVPEKDKGQLDKMIAAWVDWGKSKGKL